MCAFLAPEDVPRGLFAKHPDRLPDPLATAVRDRVTFQQALGALRRYSLATVTLKAVSVHRLVQAVVRNSLGIAQAKAWAAAAVKLVLAGFPGQADDVRVWPEAARLLPHALIATGHVRTLSACSEVLSVTWREGLGR